MPDFPQDRFTLFSNFNKSKIQGKEDEYWAKAEWPISEIKALYEYAIDPGTQTRPNQRGEECVVVSQKRLPRVAKGSGNPYLMGITSDQKPMNQQRQNLPF